MTANRVITDHGELDGIGQLTHDQLDAYVDTTAWVILSGTLGPVPPDARLLKAGANVTLTDSGPGKDLTISASGTGGGGDLISWMEVPSGTVDGANTAFTLLHVPSPTSTLMLFVNGVLQAQGAGEDYTLSGGSISFSLPPPVSANLAATYPYTSSSIAWSEVPTGAVDGFNMTFTLAHSPNPTGALMLFVNGVLQSQGVGSDYTLSGNSVVLLSAPPAGANLFATYPY